MVQSLLFPVVRSRNVFELVEAPMFHGFADILCLKISMFDATRTLPTAHGRVAQDGEGELDLAA
jgi:hypothetical protein